MRLGFLINFIILTLITSAQPKIDVIHYRFHIGLNDYNDTIYGKAEILVKFLEATNTFELDLIQQSGSNKGMQDISATGKNIRGLYKDVPQQKIRLLLLKTTAIGDTATYTITYKGIPNDGLIISKNKYGDRSFFSDNWPDRGHNWIPCHDHPGDKASVEFIVTAPQHYQVVANGIQIEESNLPGNIKLSHWKEEVPISTKVMVIGVAFFAVQLSSIVNNCIPVYSWVYPGDREKGFYDYAQAAEILPYYIKNIGPYPYKKLANVQSKTRFGGMENANTIFYPESSVNGNRKNEATIAHEIAHQWFGNMATEKTFAHLWLSEGFATYMTILYMENKYGRDTAISMLREDRDQVITFARTSKRPVVDETETDYMHLLNANSYQKGGWILHMLRRELGDSIFWKSIRKYYSTYAGSVAGTDDLRKIFEQVSGKNLQTFWNQWLYRPGVPSLSISWNYLAKKQLLEITVEQLQKEVFQFPLEFEISSAYRWTELPITKRKESFTIRVKGKPTRVIADPLTSLLFESSIKESN